MSYIRINKYVSRGAIGEAAKKIKTFLSNCEAAAAV
jgi:hypothetical protein